MDYAIAWGILISIALFIYMALDGFDIGIRILFPLSSSTQERDYMMQSIAPIWDTNETWIVLAAGGLYGVFPKAYVFIFNALYIPLIAMLIFLIFRGVSFEFRFKSPQKFKFIWSCMFCLGSLGIAICQGIILGQLIQGFQTINGEFDNNYWAWYQKFNFLTGGLISLFYGFMGANFLIYRLNGAGKARFIRISKWLLGIALVYLAALIAGRLYIIDQSATSAIFPAGPHLIERFYGFEVAIQTAKSFVIDYRGDSQLSYSLMKIAKPHQDALVQEVQNWMEQHYSQNFNLDEIAQHFNLSTRSLIRRFKAALDLAPNQYLQAMRIEAARKQLEQTDYTVEQIMLAVGYNDSSSFRRLFLKKTGLTPLDYRRRFSRHF